MERHREAVGKYRSNCVEDGEEEAAAAAAAKRRMAGRYEPVSRAAEAEAVEK